MTGHACLQSTSYFFPALTLLTFWVTFCVTFHLTNTLRWLFYADTYHICTNHDGIWQSQLPQETRYVFCIVSRNKHNLIVLLLPFFNSFLRN